MAPEDGRDVGLGSVPAALARARRLVSAGALLVASDFDGTLAHLVGDPWAARIIPGAQRALRRLAASPGVHVALISGRTVVDLADRARVGGISYRGDHGAEWAEAARGFRPAALAVEREPASPTESAMADALARRVPEIVGADWLVVEWKGSAVTFHFRAAPDVDAARDRVLDAVEQVDPEGVLVRTGGRRSLELRPVGASDKGDALRRLISRLHPAAVLMLGDDPSDALAFDVLRHARSVGEVDGLAVAVLGRPDVSAGVAARADVALSGPAACARFLAGLARETRARATDALVSGTGASSLRSAGAPPPPPPSSRGQLR